MNEHPATDASFPTTARENDLFLLSSWDLRESAKRRTIRDESSVQCTRPNTGAGPPTNV
jgi:hypothetical protein